jgi:hypothetical protein
MSASPYDLRNALIERIAKRNVPNNASLEEYKRSDALGAVNGLISSCKLPMERRAAMLARAGTSCGAIWWCAPWRLRKATATVFSPCWWCRTVIGDDGVPQGVVMFSEATWVKPGSSRRPVPPMTAMGTGAITLEVSYHQSGVSRGNPASAHRRMC